EVIRRGRQKPCLRIVRLVFAAVADPAGVIAHRPGAPERVALLLEDWDLTHKRIRQAELRMTAVLDELRLTGLVTTITGISAIGAAILRHLHAIITTGQAWDPVTATCGTQHDQAKLAA